MKKSIPVHDLYALRQKRGLTQKQVATACQISTQAYESIEQGKTNPRPETLRRLAKVLKVSQKQLRGETWLEDHTLNTTAVGLEPRRQ